MNNNEFYSDGVMNGIGKRVILHCDMNNCFASIEMLLNPKLKNKAIAVCGSQEQRHGIVLAKSEIAKKCDVKTGDAIWMAKKKCPGILIVEPHFDAYIKYSKLAYQLYQQYTHQVESFGLDECWLDVTGSQHLFGDGIEIANKIRKRMKYEIGITISVGVSFNKVFAKLASDMKKPDAVTEISAENFTNIVYPQPVTNILGVGPSTHETLRRYCIQTIGQLAQTDRSFLYQILGKHGLALWHYANGLDNSPVQQANHKDTIKSISHGTTGANDLYNNATVWKAFLALAQDVSQKLHLNELEACGIQIVVRDTSLKFRQYQGSMQFPQQAAHELATAAMELFQKNYPWDLPVRALTIRAIKLRCENAPKQLHLFADNKRQLKFEKIEQSMFKIRSKFGSNALQWASLTEHSGFDGTSHFGTKLPSPSSMLSKY